MKTFRWCRKEKQNSINKKKHFVFSSSKINKSNTKIIDFDNTVIAGKYKISFRPFTQ